MDFDVLHEFVVLAKVCHYQEAASTLMIAQSTLSKHINKLEDELGVQLFDRSKRNISLNSYGELFLNYATQICELVEKSTYALDELQNMKKSKLSIGFMMRHGQYGIMETLQEFRKQSSSDINITIIEESGELLKSLLASGKCDFVFTAESEDISAFCATPYKSDILTAVLPKNHPLSGKSTVTLDELFTEKFIEYKISYEKKIFSKVCKKYNFHPAYIASISYAPTVLSMVSQGAGISVMSKQGALSCNNPDVAIVDLQPTVSFTVYMLYSRKRKLSSAAKEFLKFIEATRDESVQQ